MTIQLCRDFNDFYDKVRNDGRKKLQFHRLGCDCRAVQVFGNVIGQDGLHLRNKNGYILCNNSSNQYKQAVTFPEDWDENKIISIMKENKNFNDDKGKHRVAQCLLQDDYRNGSVAIISPSSEEIKICIQMAREYKKMNPSVYHDHFDYFHCFPLWLLQEFVSNNEEQKDDKQKDDEQKDDEQKDVTSFIKSSICVDICNNFLQMRDTKLELKHNLKQFVKISSENDNDIDRSHFIMVGVEETRTKNNENVEELHLLLNLPGGKRSLNENALMAAQREMYEETSLFFPLVKEGKKPIYIDGHSDDNKSMRYFICRPHVNKCTSLVDLIPSFKVKQRCRICLQRNKKKIPSQKKIQVNLGKAVLDVKRLYVKSASRHTITILNQDQKSDIENGRLLENAFWHILVILKL